ncbi:redox-sensitive transcriptional activator SoxR [Allorhizobium terrae]|uniref:Redox-sensitive transcriptional activator SoxR n=1 Tax=Allorhizobium terrae TaxID=1848972 RepID=A0A4S3ZYP1_9HYPH|nr:redox-sensitive transcriptional activator SoxR [Allorhizobium terrae]THF50994.1 redox-sensitive transcriptional activator SoxR [Allorhizobium terrae]
MMSGLTVGDVARRSGVAVSALHFYERKGLISSHRTSGNQRRYDRDVLRRVAIIRAALVLGIPLAEVATLLGGLPKGATPSKEDWRKMASSWAETLDQRIRLLSRLRDDLGSCIGCGCLSMTHCNIFNANDQAGQRGSGAVLLVESYENGSGNPSDSTELP